MKIEIPKNVRTIIEKLNINGHSAYVVGGCVRDSLLIKQPEDWDITTSALPLEVKKLFPRTIDTGLKHGTVSIIIKGETYEVTTYRIDGEYEDNRRPRSVEFTDDLVEDLKRRDFTINAMAYNDNIGLVDIFDGKNDLKNGIIRCVGNPIERFNEDALRMLRAVRFSAQLKFDIEENTINAVKELSSNIKNVSAERIQVELNKLLISNHPYKFKKLYEIGLLEIIMPEFIPCFKTTQNNPHHKYTVAEHILNSLTNIEPVSILRWTMLFHDIGKPLNKTTDEEGIDHFHGHAMDSSRLAEKILRNLKFDNYTIKCVSRLVCFHDLRITPEEKQVRKAVNKVGKDIFEWLLKVQKADILAQSEYLQVDKLNTLKQIEQIYNKILSENQCVQIKELNIDGKDIIKLGVKQGKKIGEVLNYLLDLVIEDANLNQREVLIELAKEWAKQY